MWDNLRKCEAAEQVKTLKGKPADLAKCQTKFQAKHAKVTDQAADDAIACRYGVNADGTVTDYDTGLQWEQKSGEVGGECLIFVGSVNHCVNIQYTWDQAHSFVSGVSTDGTTVSSFYPGAPNGWRLPTIGEFRTILDTTVPGCPNGSPCIDPIFGPTVAGNYWSGTTLAAFSDSAWTVHFHLGVAFGISKNGSLYVRAVRTAL